MAELKLTVTEWQLLSTAYHLMLERDANDPLLAGETQSKRKAFADRLAAFSVRVLQENTPVTARIEPIPGSQKDVRASVQLKRVEE